MKRTLLTIAGIGLLSAFLAYPAFSHNPGRHMGQQMELGQRLGAGQHYGRGHYQSLSTEQQQRIDKLHESFTTDTKELRLKLHQKRAELQAVLANPTPNKAEAMKIQEELNTLRNSMMGKRLEFRLEAQKIAPEATLAGNAFCAGPGSRAGQGGRHQQMMNW